MRVAGRKIVDVEGEAVYSTQVDKEFQIGIELCGSWERGAHERAAWNRVQGWNRRQVGQGFRQHLPCRQEDDRSGEDSSGSARWPTRKADLIEGQSLHDPSLRIEESEIDDGRSVANSANDNYYVRDDFDYCRYSPDWMHNNSVRLAIVKNPKTPLHIAQKHIKKVRDHDLVLLAKSENVRDAVQKAAKRILASRGRIIN